MKSQLPKLNENKLYSPSASPLIDSNVLLPALVNNSANIETNKTILTSPPKRHFDSFRKDIKGFTELCDQELHRKLLPGLLSIKDRNNIITTTKSSELLRVSDSSLSKIGASPHRANQNTPNSLNLKNNKVVIHSILNEMLSAPEQHLRKPSKEQLDPILDEKYLPKVKYLKPLKPVIHKRLNIPTIIGNKIDGKETFYDIRASDCKSSRDTPNLQVMQSKEAVIGEMFKTHEKLMEELTKKKEDDSMVYTLKFEDCSSGSGSSHTIIDKSKIDFSLVNSKKVKEEEESVHENIVDDDDECNKGNESGSSFCSKIVDSSAFDDKKISGDNLFTCLTGIQGSALRWKALRCLGIGTYSQVLLAENVDDCTLFAVKRFLPFNQSNAEIVSASISMQKEVSIFKNLCHKNIIRYIGSEIINNEFFIYVEYLPGGELRKKLYKTGPLPIGKVKAYGKQILEGLAYLHSKQIIHRDLKCQNIMLENEMNVKLIDFGASIEIDGTQHTEMEFKGSLPWTAPEVIKCKKVSKQSDIWSYGCTLLEMATGKLPWEFDNFLQAINKIGNTNEMPCIPASLPCDLKSLIEGCLVRDFKARPSAECLLKHPFFLCE